MVLRGLLGAGAEMGGAGGVASSAGIANLAASVRGRLHYVTKRNHVMSDAYDRFITCITALEWSPQNKIRSVF